MTATRRPSSDRRATLLLAVAGLALVLVAWALPVHLTSVTPAILKQAGAGSPGAAQIGLDLLAAEKPGPAALVAETAAALDAPETDRLTRQLSSLHVTHPELTPWGGWDPFLDPLVREAAKADPPHTASTPVLTFFVTAKARETLRGFLANSRSPTVLSFLRLRELPETGRFTPASKPGGQTLDALILLAALLQQGDHPHPTLQRQLRSLAEQALAEQRLGALEPVCLDLLALGRRLDWTQLCTLLSLTPDTATLRGLADRLRAHPEQTALTFTLAVADDSAASLVNYLQTHDDTAVDDLRLALASGRDAVRLLLRRQVPVNHQPAAPAPPAFVVFSLLQPKAALAAKYLGWFLGAFLILRALDRAALGTERSQNATTRPHLVSGALALLLAGIFVAATEPSLVKPRPLPAPKLSFAVPVLGSLTEPDTLTRQPATFAMDTNTLLSISFFAALQIAMYLVCLAKIRQIGRGDLPPLVKLRLMENEENLFDGGLYVGIGGTATALVLQVLGVIEPNLLAAYSSNLFGICCVALVKIRHVRPFKHQLILDGQAAIVAAGLAPKSP
ncbi:MAG: hypothetical protein ABII82_05350 [Verrucomicrobiota bacterium]